MPDRERTDADRFRFFAEYRLSVTWTEDSVSVFWRGRPAPGQPGAYFPISTAPTLREAVDLVIERWERKHKRRFE